MKLDKWEWEEIIGKFLTTHFFVVGKWKVGYTCWESKSIGDELHYCARMKLPGIKENLGYFKTIEEAKKMIKKATKYWIKKLIDVEIEYEEGIEV